MKIGLLAASCFPIVWLIVALGVLKLRTWLAASIGLVFAAVISQVWFSETLSASAMASAVGTGIRFALCPISLVIVAALFTYRVCKRSGALLVIRRMLANVSEDSRVVALLVGWGFGGFMEGVAGFGTSVAIPAAVMAGCGMDPIRAVVACLVANAASTAYGSVGVPVLMLAKAAHVPSGDVSSVGFIAMAACFLVVPFLIVAVTSGFRALKGTWWLCLASAISFVLPCWITTQFVGPELPDAVGAICSMATIIYLNRFVRPDAAYHLQAAASARRRFSPYHVYRAACPFLFVVLLLAFYAFMVPEAKAYLTPGVIIFIAASMGAFIQGMSFRVQAAAAWTAVLKNWRTIVTICAVLAMARVMDKSGMIGLMASALVRTTGHAYAFLSPALGALGGFITGSGTNTNILFGALQKEAAMELGQNPLAFAAANMLGGGVGKMIAPQSIAIGLAAVGLTGMESTVLKRAFKWFSIVLLVACVSCGLLASFLPASSGASTSLTAPSAAVSPTR